MMDQTVYSVQGLRAKGKPLETYLEEVKEKWGTITPKDIVQPAIQSLSELLNQRNCILIVFSASWCKDCKTHLPELLNIQTTLLQEHRTRLQIYVFSGLKADALNPNNRWKIPPSPPESKIFDIFALPTFILLNAETGKVIGRIDEHPQQTGSLEEELVWILKS